MADVHYDPLLRGTQRYHMSICIYTMMRMSSWVSTLSCVGDQTHSLDSASGGGVAASEALWRCPNTSRATQALELVSPRHRNALHAVQV